MFPPQRKNILERRSQIVDDREKRKELRREHKREKAKRLDEKMKFETEMAEKYKPQKPEKKRWSLKRRRSKHLTSPCMQNLHSSN